MLLFIAFSDSVKVVSSYSPHPPFEYVPLSEEEISQLHKINRFEKFANTEVKNSHKSESSKITTLSSTDTLLLSFEAIDYTGWIPPDPQLAVGSTHVGVVVNTSIAFYRKTDGSVVYSNTFRGFFSSVIPSGGIAFDPKIVYDIPMGRWLVLALYYNDATSSSHYLLAVSQTDDPLSGWYFYRLNARYDDTTLTDNWADYPDIGFNDRWIVLSSQQIGFSSSAYYPKVRVLNKDSAYSGTLNGWTEDFVDTDLGCIYFWPRVSRSTYDYSNDVYILAFNRFIKIYGPTETPQLSPCTSLPLAYYNYPPDAPQGGGYADLEAIPTTFQVYYLNGKIYYTFHEEHPMDSRLVSGRLVILDTSGSVLEDTKLYESGVSWLYPSVAVSPKGLAISFTRVGTSAPDYPSAAYIARSAHEYTFSPVRVYRHGLSWYFNDHGYGRNRWGDYFGGGPDPVDSTVWVIAELPKAGTDSLWTTWVAHVGFKNSGVEVVERKDKNIIRGALYTIDGRKAYKLRKGHVYFLVEGSKVEKVILR